MNIHTEFIKYPVKGILRDAVSAGIGVGSGIETYPLCDYMMQSVFLKMTGSQEQKMKCIIWELATIDFDYRRVVLANEDKLGECSSYSDKNKIYKRLVAHILKYDPKFNVLTAVDVPTILRETIKQIVKLFEGTNFAHWSGSNFMWFVKKNRTAIKHEHVLLFDANKNFNLFENKLQEKYELLYNHRNRIAHNTQSYQQNLPTLKTLASDDYVYENYFLYFTILVLIDEIFRKLYGRYLQVVKENRV